MIIQTSTVAMASRHEAYLRQTRQESLTYWRNRPATPPESPRPVDRPAKTDQVSLSPADQRGGGSCTACGKVGGNDGEHELGSMDELKMELICRMLESLTGRKIRIIPPGQFMKEFKQSRRQLEEAGAALQEVAARMGRDGTSQGAQSPEGWGMVYEATRTTMEVEQTSFAAAGKVTTADGREIDFSVQLNMSRSFIETNQVTVRAGDAARLTDPLVVNFSGKAAELTATHFQFDLNADGQTEQLHFVAPGSGFLALDRSGDGKINNGTELFGPATGQGFAELASFDQDDNQWIDAADPIYQRLQIWSKDAAGKDQLLALGKAGVGAIYLGNIATDFAIKDPGNALMGQVRSTGVFLAESGPAGSVQQIDLAV